MNACLYLEELFWRKVCIQFNNKLLIMRNNEILEIETYVIQSRLSSIMHGIVPWYKK